MPEMILLFILWVGRYIGVTKAHNKALDRGTGKNRWGNKGNECVTIHTSRILGFNNMMEIRIVSNVHKNVEECILWTTS